MKMKKIGVTCLAGLSISVGLISISNAQSIPNCSKGTGVTGIAANSPFMADTAFTTWGNACIIDENPNDPNKGIVGISVSFDGKEWPYFSQASLSMHGLSLKKEIQNSKTKYYLEDSASTKFYFENMSWEAFFGVDPGLNKLWTLLATNPTANNERSQNMENEGSRLDAIKEHFKTIGFDGQKIGS